MIKIFWTEDEAPRGSKTIGQLGGIPNMASHLHPNKCRRCNSQLAYFFTINLDDIIKDTYMSFFYCISCSDKYSPDQPDLREDISIQKSDSFKVDHDIILHTDAKFEGNIFSPLVPSKISGKKSKDQKWRFSKIGGSASLQSYITEGNRYDFLLQIREEDLKFPTLPESPKQKIVKWFDNDPSYIDQNYYMLFGGLPIFFFLLEKDEDKAFLITNRF